MGFTDWLAYQLKTFGVGILSIILSLLGVGFIIQNQPIAGAVMFVIGVLGLLWVRYQGREHQIRTEQRKYGRR